MAGKRSRRRSKKDEHVEEKLDGAQTDVSAPTPEKSLATTVSVDKYLAAFLVLAVLVSLYLFIENYNLKGQSTTTQTTYRPPQTTLGGQPKSGAASLKFYVMSQCPYGTQVMDAIAPALKELGGSVDFDVDFISSYNPTTAQFSSLHGQPETDENIRQLCAKKYYSNGYKYMDYITCRNKNIKSADWASCAKEAGLDDKVIKSCFDGPEGKNLLIASSQAAQNAQASGSPTMYLNGQKYNGGRQTQDFLRSICNTLTTKPQACANLPEPVKFQVIVLKDKRCAECNTANIESSLKNMFPGITFKAFDYGSAEGKKLFEDSNLKFLPAFLFDEKVNADPNYGNIQRYMVAAGKYRSLLAGATFDPTAEICDNKIDDTGDGKIDCVDETCVNKLVCRPEVAKKADVFIMSQCPYGVQAVNSMKEVLSAVTDLKFDIHYIADFDPSTDSFKSLHGQAEVDENIRQLCAKKQSSEKYLNYIWCRNKNVASKDWAPCAKEAGIDETAIKSCSEGSEGKNLLIEDIKIGNALGMSASPTWLSNNKYQFSGIAAEAIKTNLCKYNQGLAGCEKTLSEDTGGVSASGGC